MVGVECRAKGIEFEDIGWFEIWLVNGSFGASSKPSQNRNFKDKSISE